MKLCVAKRRSEGDIGCLLPLVDEQERQAQSVMSLPMTTESLVLSQETRVHVHAGIDRLPAAYRTVLILPDIDEDLDTAEAAEILGITLNAVKIGLHRARQALMMSLYTS